MRLLSSVVHPDHLSRLKFMADGESNAEAFTIKRHGLDSLLKWFRQCEYRKVQPTVPEQLVQPFRCSLDQCELDAWMFRVKLSEKSHEIDRSDGTHYAKFHWRMLEPQKFVSRDLRAFFFGENSFQMGPDQNSKIRQVGVVSFPAEKLPAHFFFQLLDR